MFDDNGADKTKTADLNWSNNNSWEMARFKFVISVFISYNYYMFNEIEIDRVDLTIMGVKFADLKTLEGTANALGSNMFEGFIPTPKGIEIIRDYVSGKISLNEMIAFANEKAYV